MSVHHVCICTLQLLFQVQYVFAKLTKTKYKKICDWEIEKKENISKQLQENTNETYVLNISLSIYSYTVEKAVYICVNYDFLIYKYCLMSVLCVIFVYHFIYFIII